jgi:hypothetical protein
MADQVQVNVSEPTQMNVSEPTQMNVSEPTQMNVSEPTQMNVSEPTQMNVSEPTQMNVSEPNYVDVAPPVTDPDQMTLDESNPLIITGTKRKFTEFNEYCELNCCSCCIAVKKISDELNDYAAKRSFNNHQNTPTIVVQDEEHVSENQVQSPEPVDGQEEDAPAPDDQPVEYAPAPG